MDRNPFASADVSSTGVHLGGNVDPGEGQGGSCHDMTGVPFGTWSRK